MARSTNVGALSFTFEMVTVNSGDVTDSSPSAAMTFKLYILLPLESDGFSKSGVPEKDTTVPEIENAEASVPVIENDKASSSSSAISVGVLIDATEVVFSGYSRTV